MPLRLDANAIESPHWDPIVDEASAIRDALRNPIASPPLAEVVKPGESVCIIVNDITRLARSDMFLPPLSGALNEAGVPDDEIFIVFALGTHRRQTESEQRTIVGDEIFRRIRLFDHDAVHDLVTLGTTSFGNKVEVSRRVMDADRVILTGEIIFHQIAGFSGGRKSMVPGVAGNETITFNHRMILDPRCRAGVLDGNPAHEDLLEAARMAEPDFLLNVILNAEGALLHVVAGHFDAAHREGCKAAERLLQTEIGEPFDIVIASAGGAPLDIDLRQAHKGMENACAALRPGGVLYYYAECADGFGSPMLARYLSSYATEAAMEDALRENFVVGGHKALWLKRIGTRYESYLVTSFDAKYVRKCGFHPVPPDRHAAALRELMAKRPGARVGVMRHAGFTAVGQISRSAEGSPDPDCR